MSWTCSPLAQALDLIFKWPIGVDNKRQLLGRGPTEFTGRSGHWQSGFIKTEARHTKSKQLSWTTFQVDGETCYH